MSIMKQMHVKAVFVVQSEFGIKAGSLQASR
jgi:hypothetical protein